MDSTPGVGGNVESAVIGTPRLDLPVASADALQALIAGDAGRLVALTGARFPDPLVAPPLTEDALPMFVARLRDEPSIAPWWFRLIVLRETMEAVGSIGFAGPPDADGVVIAGYSVYPAHQGNGYASEAFVAIVAWALDQPEVARVRATVQASNAPSLAVAHRAGLRAVAVATDEEVGEVEVWETPARVATPSGRGQAGREPEHDST